MTINKLRKVKLLSAAKERGSARNILDIIFVFKNADCYNFYWKKEKSVKIFNFVINPKKSNRNGVKRRGRERHWNFVKFCFFLFCSCKILIFYFLCLLLHISLHTVRCTFFSSFSFFLSAHHVPSVNYWVPIVVVFVFFKSAILL